MAGEPLITPETIGHVAAVVREKGTDAWWLSETADLLPEGLRDRAEEYRRGDDTMVSTSLFAHATPPLTFLPSSWGSAGDNLTHRQHKTASSGPMA